MRVIPVIDLKGGVAVHAVGGFREQYAPVRSRLATTADPRDIAAAFAKLGLREVYVADLDAIGCGELQQELYEAIAQAGLVIWLDAGIRDRRRAAEIAALDVPRPLHGIVVALESITSLEALAEILDVIGRDRAVFSLDLQHGEPLADPSAWRGQSALEIALSVCALGIQRMIVLDLADVGTAQGASTFNLCMQLRANEHNSNLELVAGGGVRSTADLAMLADAGCNAALVATALHDGSITRADLEQFDVNNTSGSGKDHRTP